MLIENSETVNCDETGSNIQINQPVNIIEVSMKIFLSKGWWFHTHPIMNQMAIFIVLGKIPLWVSKVECFCQIFTRLINIQRGQTFIKEHQAQQARLAQSVARETLNLKVVGSSPTSG
jgi:hypothetical protein